MARRKEEKKERRYSNAKERAEKHESGGEWTSLKMPKEIPFFQVKKAGIYKFDILAYVAGKGNPYADEGELHYERTFWTHRIQTIEGNKPYVCLAKTFKKKCPVCKWRDGAAKDSSADPKEVKDLAPKERQLFLVIDRTSEAETAKGPQLWEYSHFLFGKPLDDKIKSSDEEDNYEKFFHLDGGMTLKVTFAEESMGGGTNFYKAVSIDMKPRKVAYDDDLLDTLPCLDDLPRELPYKDLENIFLQVDSEEEEEKKATPPSRNGKASSKKDDDDEDEKEDEDEDEEAEIASGDTVKHKKLGECAVTKITEDGLTLRDAKGRYHKDVDPGECEKVEKDEDEDEDDEDSDKPIKAGKSSKDEDEDEEEDEEEDIDEDEEEEEKPAAKNPKGRAGKR
jgi:hypothetical protein